MTKSVNLSDTREVPQTDNMENIGSSRISPILPKIINPTQERFVKGRYTFEKVLTCQETMDWEKCLG